MNWNYLSICLGILSFLVTYLLTKNSTISIVLAILVSIIVLVYNPKRRYMKAFWALMSLFLILNRLVFELSGKILGINFIVASEKSELALSVSLLLLAMLCLFLDYKERNPGKSLTNFRVFRGKDSVSSSQKILNNGKINKQVNINKNKGKIEL